MTRKEAAEKLTSLWYFLTNNDYPQKDLDALKVAIKALEQEPKWIPVSERLPKDGEVTLFSTKTDRIFEGRYFDDDTDFQWYAFYDETFVEDNVVTAWMPLPTPYKSESEVES
jgi:hypothetical protein